MADLESVSPIVQQLTKLLQSQPMFKLLRTMTGLELADLPLSDDDNDSSGDDGDNEGNKVKVHLLAVFLPFFAK